MEVALLDPTLASLPSFWCRSYSPSLVAMVFPEPQPRLTFDSSLNSLPGGRLALLSSAWTLVDSSYSRRLWSCLLTPSAMSPSFLYSSLCSIPLPVSHTPRFPF